MSLFFKTLSRFCHSFSSKEQAPFNVMAAVTICSDFGAQENKVSHCFHCFPIYLPRTIKIAGRNINNLRYADDTTLMAESEEELRSLLMNMKEESEKVVLKFNIQKTKIMASGPITQWEIGKQ